MRKCIQKKQFFPFFFIALFGILTSLSVFMYGDDYLWYYSTEDPQLSSWAAPNGRFVSNQITVWLCRSISFRTIFIAFFYCFMLIFLSNLFDFRNITKSSKYYLTLLLFIFIPSKTYAETVLWISGFANYIFPIYY